MTNYTLNQKIIYCIIKVNKMKCFTYTSDFIEDLLSNIRSSGVDARNIARASSGVKLCVAISFYNF